MMGNENEQLATQRPLRAGRSVIYSFVRFSNKTLRCVDIVWLNYEGARVKMKTLQPNEFVDVNTYVGHPWIFCDSDTGDRLVVQLKEVYEPVGWTNADGWPPTRKIVNITIPVYSLLDRCLQILRECVPKDKIDLLDLPKSLKLDLSQMYVTMVTARSILNSGSQNIVNEHQGDNDQHS